MGGLTTNVNIKDLILKFDNYSDKIKISDVRLKDFNEYFLSIIFQKNYEEWNQLLNNAIFLLKESIKKNDIWHLCITSDYIDYDFCFMKERNKDEDSIKKIDDKIKKLLYLMVNLNIIDFIVYYFSTIDNFSKKYCIDFYVRTEEEIKIIFNEFKNKIRSLESEIKK